MTSLTSKIAASVAALLLSAVAVSTQATPAHARNSAGDISLKVEATCGQGLGDSIRSFAVWTPEKGNKVVKNVDGHKATIDFGKFKKKDRGNTFFNWSLECKLSGKTGSHQKKYGGNAIQTKYFYKVKQDANRGTTYP